MKKIVLISCSAKKKNYPTQAKDLYDSPLFKYSLKYAETLKPDAIRILSAKYGLLNPEEKIKPYELTLKKMKKEEKIAWAQKVLNQIKKEFDIENTEFIILAGKEYYTYLLPHFKHWKLPLKGLGIGQRIAWLKNMVKTDD